MKMTYEVIYTALLIGACIAFPPFGVFMLIYGWFHILK